MFTDASLKTHGGGAVKGAAAVQSLVLAVGQMTSCQIVRKSGYKGESIAN